MLSNYAGADSAMALQGSFWLWDQPLRDGAVLWCLLLLAEPIEEWSMRCSKFPVPHYHHNTDVSECVELLYCLSGTFPSSVCLRLSQFSQLFFRQYMGLCVFSWPIYLMMIMRICVLCLIIIIKLEVWPIAVFRFRSWNNGMRCMSVYIVIDLIHKSHCAPVICHRMHHFVTEMCTGVHISVTKRCIVRYSKWPAKHSRMNKPEFHVCKYA